MPSKLINKLAKKRLWRRVIETYLNLRPLDSKTALAIYTAPLKWLSALGRKRLWESMSREYLLLNSKYGKFVTHKTYIRHFLGEYEIDNIILGLLKDNSTFVDAGAFLGLYTVVACKKVKKVIAVEPNPYALALLKTNILLNNCSNVHVVNKAVASGKGFLELKIPRAENTLISVSASIVFDFADSYRITVETDTLDNIVAEAGIERADVVKVDIEGAEGIAFEGMRDTLRKARAVMMEIWPENMWIMKEMKNMGYKLTNIIKHIYSKNYVFIKSP